MPSQHPRHHIGLLRNRHGFLAAGSGVLALAALVAGSAWGNVRSSTLDARLVGWVSAGTLLVFGVLSVTRSAGLLGRLVTRRSLPSAGGAVRILSAAVGYLVAFFGVLAILDVSISKLLVGAGLAGIVLGIAATQSLGNVFAGMVLIFARPFAVGDHIRVRSGALGGVFDAWVVEMSLTYTTVRLDDATWKIPNSALLSAGVGQLPRTRNVPPLPQVPTATPAAGLAQAPAESHRPLAGSAPSAGSSPAADGAGAPSPGTNGQPAGQPATAGTPPPAGATAGG